MNGGTHGQLHGQLLAEPPNSQMRSPNPSIYFGKLIFWVRVPSERTLQTESFPALDLQNDEK
jgi:hypothetical protein